MSGPTVAKLAAKHGAGFTFTCRPCGRHKLYTGDGLTAFVRRFDPELTFVNLVAGMYCPQCRMPIDGAFRTFTFHCTTDPEEARKAGHTPYGWSGPR